MIPQCSVIIPFLNSCEERSLAFHHVGAWWKENYPDWEIRIGTPDPWTKGLACHEAVNKSGSDILIVADADCFIYEIDRVQDYVNMIRLGVAKWIVPHNKVYRLSAIATQQVYDENVINLKGTHYPPYMSCYGGGMVILSREAWEISGGIDHRFSGWGGEDRSWGYALETLVGPVFKGDSKLIHLWHGNQGPRNPVSRENIKLIEKYQKARYRPHLMRQLRDEARGMIGVV